MINFLGILGGLILVAGAAWPVHEVSHPVKSIKNWLYGLGAFFMLLFSTLGYFYGDALFFFVILQLYVVFASVLMFLNIREKLSIILLSIGGLGMVVWSLFLLEDLSTIWFILGLCGIAIGYALKTGSRKRNVVLCIGSLLLTIFSFLGGAWIFFFINLFFSLFSAIYVWGKKILFLPLLVFLGFLGFTFLKSPSHDLNWNDDGKFLSQAIERSDSTIKITDVRDWSFDENGPNEKVWNDIVVNPKNIKDVWFVSTPFSTFEGIAHTMLMFEFRDADPLLVSVEARKEADESYSALRGLWNNYELVYLWGTPQDFLGRRALVDLDPIRMMKVRAKDSFKQNIFLDFIERTNEVYAEPKFYNTVLHNCTNELAHAANRETPGAVPWSISYVLPGYADETLYDLGFIDTDKSWEDAERDSYIQDFIKQNYNVDGWEQSLFDR